MLMVNIGDKVIISPTNCGDMALTEGRSPAPGDQILISRSTDSEKYITHGISSIKEGDKVIQKPYYNELIAVKGGSGLLGKIWIYISRDYWYNRFENEVNIYDYKLNLLDTIQEDHFNKGSYTENGFSSEYSYRFGQIYKANISGTDFILASDGVDHTYWYSLSSDGDILGEYQMNSYLDGIQYEGNYYLFGYFTGDGIWQNPLGDNVMIASGKSKQPWGCVYSNYLNEHGGILTQLNYNKSKDEFTYGDTIELSPIYDNNIFSGYDTTLVGIIQMAGLDPVRWKKVLGTPFRFDGNKVIGIFERTAVTSIFNNYYDHIDDNLYLTINRLQQPFGVVTDPKIEMAVAGRVLGYSCPVGELRPGFKIELIDEFLKKYRCIFNGYISQIDTTRIATGLSNKGSSGNLSPIDYFFEYENFWFLFGEKLNGQKALSIIDLDRFCIAKFFTSELGILNEEKTPADWFVHIIDGIKYLYMGYFADENSKYCIDVLNLNDLSIYKNKFETIGVMPVRMIDMY